MENKKDTNLIGLIREFIKEITLLADEHLKLIKKDIKDSVYDLLMAVVSIIVALVASIVGLIFLGFLVISLAQMLLPEWTAVLLVTAIFFGVPLILFIYALYLINKVFKQPKKSITELEKTTQEAKKWMNNVKK